MQIISVNKTPKIQAYLTDFQIKILIKQCYLNEKNVLKTPWINSAFAKPL